MAPLHAGVAGQPVHQGGVPQLRQAAVQHPRHRLPCPFAPCPTRCICTAAATPGTEAVRVGVEVQGGHGGGTAHGMGGVRVPVQQRIRLLRPLEHLEHFGGRQSHRQGQQATSKQLGIAGNVGLHAQYARRTDSPQPPQPGEHFIEDDGDAALPALRHQLALEQRVHQHHPPRPLQEGLDDSGADHGACTAVQLLPHPLTVHSRQLRFVPLQVV
mmetsp:Transcript_19432/g.58710  ORF Transcript_19432/g.58710 Transcript_19432/m.58710 type:complete len:214 (+) Transcript_19432:662-1303(+)